MQTGGRRGFLRAVLAAGAVAAAGCSGLTDTGTPAGTPTDRETEDEATTPTDTEEELRQNAVNTLKDNHMISEDAFTLKDDRIVVNQYNRVEVPLEYNPQPGDTPVERSHKINDATHGRLHDDKETAGQGPLTMARIAMYLNQHGPHSMFPSDETLGELAKANAEIQGQPNHTEIGESNSLLLTDANLRNAGSRIGNYVFALDGETPVGLSIATYNEVKIYGDTPYTTDGNAAQRATTDLGSMVPLESDSCGEDGESPSRETIMGVMGEYGQNIVLDEGEQGNVIPMWPEVEDGREIERMLEEDTATKALEPVVGLSLANYDNQDIKERDPGYGRPVIEEDGFDIVEGEQPVKRHYLDTICSYNN